MTFVVPLESNPDVLNKFMSLCGVSSSYQLYDVYGLDDDLLCIVPQPVKAFILLFPCRSETYEAHRQQEDEKLKANPQKIPENLFYMRQYVRNACGTVALFHAVLNNLDSIEVEGPLREFYEKTKNLSPEDRGRVLEQSEDLIRIHQSLAREGQSEVPDDEEKILFHFLALTKVGDELFELDGSLKNFPISHGKTSKETFVKDAAEVCKKFMERERNDVRFTIMALAAKVDDY